MSDVKILGRKDLFKPYVRRYGRSHFPNLGGWVAYQSLSERERQNLEHQIQAATSSMDDQREALKQRQVRTIVACQVDDMKQLIWTTDDVLPLMDMLDAGDAEDFAAEINAHCLQRGREIKRFVEGN
ncbi:MAG: hypothetical protein HC841_00310 [Verrucomicrobiae bacterium]|nr:hypothetical protein [Verrucomicrobiae bacterium]